MIDQIFTALLKAEIQAHPGAVVLHGFPRLIQLDRHSCGAKSVQAILQYYGIHVPFDRLMKQLRTDMDGTSVADIKRVLARYRLTSHTLRNPTIRKLKGCIDQGRPVLISMFDGEHYAPVVAYSTGFVFVANPSIDARNEGVGQIRCAVVNREFNQWWDHWGIVVTPRGQ